MLNAAAMKDLLTANVDENASHFAFFSHHGTIMGHDHTANVKSTKRFAAFAANTWAHNDISLRETGRTVHPLTPGTTILQAVVKEDDGGGDGDGDGGGGGGRELHALIVQVDGLVGAVTHVREGTLVAALKGKGEFWGDGGSEGGGGGKGRGLDRADGGSMGEGSGVEDDGDGRGKEAEGEGEGDGVEEGPSKMQILLWRSEGMGQYVAEELGPKFKIPKGFY